MNKQEKSRKPLIIGIIAAVLILAVLLVLLLTQCTPGGGGSASGKDTSAQTVGAIGEAVHYDLYWNLDRALYDGKSEAGLSSRQPESDGFFHVRFFKDGEILELKVADRKTVNAMEVNDLMGLEFDENGIVVGIISLDDMPLQQVGWKFYVQSVGGNLMKLNSAKTSDGMELLLEILDGTGIYDMTGAEGEVGKRIIPTTSDRVIAIANLAGELTHVYIYERSEYMQSFVAECQHCKQTVTWKIWNKPDSLPTADGHYQLSDDIVMAKQASIEEDAKICLDLNGKVVDGPDNKRMYSLHNVGANLALMDTSEEQTGVLRGHSISSPQGGVVWVRYGAFYMYGGTLDGGDMTSTLNGTVVQVNKGCYFYMYNGTIIGGTSKWTYNEETKKYGNGLGGALAVSGKFVMHDGLITGGKAESVVTAWNKDGTPKTYQRGIGGNIYVAGGGEFEMKGGKIQNGVAGHSGGNVYLDGASTMIMDGGMITGGAVAGKGRNGGNVFVTTKATFEMNGGSINWGTSHNCAGNLYFNGTVVMNGGYIGKGVVRDWATGKVKPTNNTANVFQVGGKMTMYGGIIEGSYTITDTSATDKITTTLVLAGMPVISADDSSQYEDLVLTNGGSGVKVIVGTLLDSAKVGVNATTGIFTTPTSEANVDNFYSTINGADVHYVDGCVALGRWSCVCGSEKHFGKCDGTQLFWAPINSNAIPKTTGNYFLAKDATVSSQVQIAENADVKLDLNGYTLTGPNNHRTLATFNKGSKLTVTDTSEAKTGTIKARGASATQGAAVWVRYGSFDLYGGILDGSGYKLHTNWANGKDKIYGTKDDKTEARDGGTVAVGTGTTFNMYGGTIIGTTAEAYTAEKTVTEGEGDSAVKKTVTREMTSPNGGALAVSKDGVFNMYGGTIRDGLSHRNGGNIYASSNAVLNIYGGTISGGRAGMFGEDGALVTYQDAEGKTKVKSAGWGGNISLADSAVLNISGGTVTGGVSGGNGGNIYLGKTPTVNMTGGLVTNGESTTDQGGNLFISGIANLTGGTISGGKAKNGGNIGINSSKDVTLAGVTVTGGVVPGNGGNIRMSTTNTTGSLIIAEGTVITGGQAKKGGNLCVESNNANKNNPVALAKITGGTIENGLANGDYGGNVYMSSSTVLEMSGGTIIGGKSVITKNGGKGGNLYINGATVTVSGGTISNGQAGRLAADGKSVEFGTNDSTKRGWGGNISMNGDAGSLTISGKAQILGGTAGRNGGSIHVEGGTLNMSGGTVSGGTSKADQGGNIWMGTGTTLNVTGGEIKDGTTFKNGGNIHTNAGVNVLLDNVTISGGSAYGSKTYKNANVNLSAGENITIGSVKIAGYVSIASSVKLTGKPVINQGSTNLTLNGNDINIEGLDMGEDIAKVGITDASAGIFTGDAQKGEEEYFFSDDETKVVGFVNGKLSLTEGRLGMGRYRCLCGKQRGYEGEHAPGCDEQIRFWAAWTSNNSLPTENGNWYLTSEEIRFSTQFAMEEGAEIAIDLNGCVVTDTNNRMLTTSKNNSSGNVTLWITDTSEAKTGTLKMVDDSYDGPGMILWLDTGSTLNLIAGTLDASQTQNLGDVGDSYGNAIDLAGKSTVNMYGGTIMGGTAVKGGAVYVATGSTFNLSGGEITGGTALYSMSTDTAEDKEGNEYTVYETDSGKGGAVYVAGTLNMTGGTITGGKAVRGNVQNGVNEKDEPTYADVGGNGGNICIGGTMNMSGGTVSNGKAGIFNEDGTIKSSGWGGNIEISDGGSLSVSGTAQITGGQSGGNGGNIRIGGSKASMTMTAGTVSDGKSVADQGGNIFASGSLNVSGTAQITGGEARNGGNIGINGNTTVTISGTAQITDGEATGNGGNIRIYSSQTTKCELVIEGNAQITDGEAKNGGNIALELINANSKGSLTMTGGTVSGGTAKYGDGGNIYVAAKADVVVSGGAITSGFAQREATKKTGGSGGNIYALGNVKITGGTVSGGMAYALDANGAPNYGDSSTKTGWGGNINLGKGGSLTIEDDSTDNTGTQILGGVAAGNGGSIYVNGNGSLTISGGTISGGQTMLDNGGNIWLAGGATLEVSDGIIYSGIAKKNGGNIHSNAGTTISLTGGRIYGGIVNGSAVNASANVNIASGSGDITLGSVQVDGYVKIGNNNAVTITGAPVITGAAAGKNNLDIGSIKLTLKDMSEGANVGITAVSSAGIFTAASDNADTYKAYFTADNGGAVGVVDNCLALGRVYCLCGDADGHDDTSATTGCNGEVLFWQPWTDGAKLPTKTGNYYLTKTVTVTSTHFTDVADQNVAIDLNDQTVQATGNFRMVRINKENTHLTITDTGSKGTIKHTGRNDQGTILWVATANSSVTLIDGTLDASGARWRTKKDQNSKYTGDDADSWYNAHGGNAVCAAGGGTFTMYGGTVMGGTTPYGAADAILVDAANNSAGTVKIYGGTVEGKATTNIAIRALGNLEIHGGTISGKVELSNRYDKATLTLSGAPVIPEILLNNANNDGTAAENAYALPTITIIDTLSNTTPIGISSMNNAEMVFATNTEEANETKFTAVAEDRAIEFYDGDLYLAKYACLCGNIGGKHVGTYTDPDGNTVGCDGTQKLAWIPWTSTTTLPTTTGNFYLTAPVVITTWQNISKAADVVLDLNGYEVSVNEENNCRIYSLFDQTGTSLTITDNYVVPAADSAEYDANRTGGKLICDSSYAKEGGAVWVRYAGNTFTLIRGALVGAGENSTTTKSGAVVAASGKFYMLGGKLINGKTSANGGNVSIANGASMYMVGGEISGGSANNGGNVDINDTATFIMSGGHIYGGTAKVNNTDAVQMRGTMVMSGGKIEGTIHAFNYRRASGSSITLSNTVDIEHIHLDRYSDLDDLKTADVQFPPITITGTLGTTVTENGVDRTLSPITITTRDAVDHYFATTTVEANAARFTTNYEGKAIHYIDGKLYLGKYSCLCGGNGNTDTTTGGTCVGATEGCDSQLHVWTLTSDRPTTSGYWYLAQDLTIPKAATVKSVDDPDVGINLDLNGYDVIIRTNNEAGRMYSTRGSGTNKVSILFTNTHRGTDRDSSFIVDDSKHDDETTTPTGGDEGRIVWMQGSDTHVKVYNVDFDISDAVVRSNANKNGIVFSCDPDATGVRSTLELYNVTVIGGKTTGSVIAVHKNADALLHDTAISGHVGGASYSGVNVTSDTSTLTLSGTTYVSGNKLSDGITASNIKLASGAKITLAEGYTGTAGMVTGITATLGAEDAPVDVVIGDTASLTYAVKDLFTTDDGKVLGFADGKLTAYAAGSHVHCVCAGALGNKDNGYVYDVPGTEDDHVCEDIVYTAISGEITGGNITTGGNFFLQDDVTIKGDHYKLTGVTTNLCLNGHNWTGADSRRALALQSGTNYLSLTTCQADVLDANGIPTNNRVVATGYNSQGFGVWVNSGTFDFYAGCIDGREFKSKSNGAIVNVTANQTMNMYTSKCTILGGTNDANKNGATIGSYGTTNMYNGTIKNGTSSHYAGNLHISSGVFTMYDGLITGGSTTADSKKWSANGAMAGGTFNMLGGQIDGGFGQLGDADANNATLVISGDAVIDGGTSGYNLRDTSRLAITVKDLKDTAKIVLDLTSSQTIAVEGTLPENWAQIITADGYTATLNDAKTEITFTETVTP